MRVALVSPHPLLPATTGDRVRAAQLVPALRRLDVDVRLIWASYDDDVAASESARVVPGRPRSRPARIGWRVWLAGARLLDPYAIHRWPPLRSRLAAIIDEVDPDVVDFQHTFAWFRVDRPSVMTAIDVNSHRLQRAGRTGAALRRVRAMERAALRGADVAVALSELDAGRLRSLGRETDQVMAVPLGHDPGGDRITVRERARTAAFVGSFGYGPNVDAARTLVDRWGTLRQAGGFDRLLVIGRGAGAHVRPTDSIAVRSDVADATAALADADVLIVPLTSGGGVRVKIIEAMALGLPVVSTAIGIEGLGAVDGVHAAIASDLDTLPEACRRVRPRHVRAAMAEAGRHLWEQCHSPSRMAEGMLTAYRRALASRR